MTEDLVRHFSAELKQDMTPIFDQYLRRANLPTLELTFDEKAGTVSYRWNADERGFAMPIKVGAKGELAGDPADDGLEDDAKQARQRAGSGDRALLRERRHPRRRRPAVK